MTASELYAMSQGSKCEGPHSCHWCGAPCKPLWRHDDASNIPFQRTTNTAKKPNELYICIGCWMFRRSRITVKFLDGHFLDGKSPIHYSWWITTKGAWAIEGLADLRLLLDEITGPPTTFALLLLSEPPPPSKGIPTKSTNFIQLAVANNLTEIKQDTPLQFTLDGVVHYYSVYELEQGINHGHQGRPGGVRVLIELMKIEVQEREEQEEPIKKGRKGRPQPLRDAKQLNEKIV